MIVYVDSLLWWRWQDALMTLTDCFNEVVTLKTCSDHDNSMLLLRWQHALTGRSVGLPTHFRRHHALITLTACFDQVDSMLWQAGMFSTFYLAVTLQMTLYVINLHNVLTFWAILAPISGTADAQSVWLPTRFKLVPLAVTFLCAFITICSVLAFYTHEISYKTWNSKY